MGRTKSNIRNRPFLIEATDKWGNKRMMLQPPSCNATAVSAFATHSGHSFSRIESMITNAKIYKKTQTACIIIKSKNPKNEPLLLFQVFWSRASAASHCFVVRSDKMIHSYWTPYKPRKTENCGFGYEECQKKKMNQFLIVFFQLCERGTNGLCKTQSIL